MKLQTQFIVSTVFTIVNELYIGSRCTYVTMASNNIIFSQFDASKDKIGVYLSRFKFHCKILNLDLNKSAQLLLSSLDGETFEKLQIHAKPVKLEDLNFQQIENMLIALLDMPTSFRSERFHFHTMSQKLRQPLVDYIQQLKSQANKCQYETFLN